MRRASLIVVLAAVAAVACFVQFGSRAIAAESGSGLQVVAAENVWGSIATELGGNRVHVTSIIASPATDPHDYEPTAIDARALAGAQMAIVNGVGYDPWASKLIAANPVHGRVVLDVGDLVGSKAGENPHLWYSPRHVQQVVDAIVRDYSSLARHDATYFQRRKAIFETRELAQYRSLIAAIRRNFHGVPVGASESIFAPLAQALGLRLVTPPTFLKAISEGTDPAARDKTTLDRQIARKSFKVWIYNSQNSTPDVQRITDAARKQRIAVTTITETLSPASATFQTWQARQLRALQAALAKSTGR